MDSLMCLCRSVFVFFFKQKTAYEMRISDWSSDVCSSDLRSRIVARAGATIERAVDAARDTALAGEKAMRQRCQAGRGERSGQAGRRDGMETGGHANRSEERRVGKECGCTSRSRCARCH